MTEITEALERLAAAVRRLDSAAEQNREREDAEKHRLSTELVLLRAEYSGLSGVTGEISDRLDAAIERLQDVLDEEPQ